MKLRRRVPSRSLLGGWTEGLEYIPEAPRGSIEAPPRRKVKRALRAAQRAKRRSLDPDFSMRIVFELRKPLLSDGCGGVGGVLGLEREDFDETRAIFAPYLEEAGLELKELEMAWVRMSSGGSGNFTTLEAHLIVS